MDPAREAFQANRDPKTPRHRAMIVRTPNSTFFRMPTRSGLRAPKLSIRTAIVGTGYIAAFHARAIRQLEGLDLVSVCDANLSSARSFAAKWGIPAAFDSLELMLRDQQLDCVHLLVAPDQHYSLARTVLQSGVHVFVEK